MATYTTTQEFKPRIFNGVNADRVIVIKTNGGSIELQMKVGEDWVATDTITTDGAKIIFPGRKAVRVVPSGGAAYEI